MRRRISNKAIKYEILVFTEGTVTEEKYLTHLARDVRQYVNVQIADSRGTTPERLVRDAMDAKKREAADARRGRGRPHDEVWCMFDVDQHPNLLHVVHLAREHDIQLAISNPCIELWFLLHLQEQGAFLNPQTAQSACKLRLGIDKHLGDDALAILDENYELARKRAASLDARHLRNGTEFPRNNPSSSVWKLVDAIRSRA